MKFSELPIGVVFKFATGFVSQVKISENKYRILGVKRKIVRIIKDKNHMIFPVYRTASIDNQ